MGTKPVRLHHYTSRQNQIIRYFYFPKELAFKVRQKLPRIKKWVLTTLAFSMRKRNGVAGEKSISGRDIPWGFSCEEVQRMESRNWFSGGENTNEKRAGG
ncbi:hypothetical protein CDAR_494961 [Caerostris darwini]|uniref:Uncharacterized protein n=1 Tax=Caerostris darwini TaxID=1538125 RepID=A0AAV4RTW4_9ARAC|nr:hypothetical protein CDAR_494961 [Caerostris darwini]